MARVRAKVIPSERERERALGVEALWVVVGVMEFLE